MYKKEGVNTFFGANSYIIPKTFYTKLYNNYINLLYQMVTLCK